MTTHTDIRPPARRGFAAMDKDRQREIARKGGASVPDEKRSFSQNRDLAAQAGRKGGEASHGGGRRRSEDIDAIPSKPI
jgi:general stress protein YciG